MKSIFIRKKVAKTFFFDEKNISRERTEIDHDIFEQDIDKIYSIGDRIYIPGTDDYSSVINIKSFRNTVVYILKEKVTIHNENCEKKKDSFIDKIKRLFK